MLLEIICYIGFGLIAVLFLIAVGGLLWITDQELEKSHKK